MISIIISSCNNKYLYDLEQNISNTVGLDYEIIKIDNPSVMGICEAYNIGASKAKYSYLCFIHEDVKFLTHNWGANLLNHFTHDSKTGVIGVAGSTYKIKMLSSWWQPSISGTDPKRTNYVQIIAKTKTKKHFFLNPLSEIRSTVATLDGVFLATKKEIWMQNQFDQKLLTGFHGYDLDFSLRIGERFNNYVVYNILLEHDSQGVNDINWFNENFLVHQKNKKRLPVIIDKSINSKQLRGVEKSYLEGNVRFISNTQLKSFKAFSIFMQLIISSRLFKWNNIFLKSFLNELSQKFK